MPLCPINFSVDNENPIFSNAFILSVALAMAFVVKVILKTSVLTNNIKLRITHYNYPLKECIKIYNRES